MTFRPKRCIMMVKGGCVVKKLWAILLIAIAGCTAFTPQFDVVRGVDGPLSVQIAFRVNSGSVAEFNWGDGEITVEAAWKEDMGWRWFINGSHVYAEPGTYSIQVWMDGKWLGKRMVIVGDGIV